MSQRKYFELFLPDAIINYKINHRKINNKKYLIINDNSNEVKALMFLQEVFAIHVYIIFLFLQYDKVFKILTRHPLSIYVSTTPSTYLGFRSYLSHCTVHKPHSYDVFCDLIV